MGSWAWLRSGTRLGWPDLSLDLGLASHSNNKKPAAGRGRRSLAGGFSSRIRETRRGANHPAPPLVTADQPGFSRPLLTARGHLSPPGQTGLKMCQGNTLMTPLGDLFDHFWSKKIFFRVGN